MDVPLPEVDRVAKTFPSHLKATLNKVLASGGIDPKLQERIRTRRDKIKHKQLICIGCLKILAGHDSFGQHLWLHDDSVNTRDIDDKAALVRHMAHQAVASGSAPRNPHWKDTADSGSREMGWLRESRSPVPGSGRQRPNRAAVLEAISRVRRQGCERHTLIAVFHNKRLKLGWF